MIKKIFSFLIFLITVFLFFSHNSYIIAADDGGVESQRWVCLSPTVLNGTGDSWKVRLELSKSPKEIVVPNSDTYIVECIETSGGQLCTTGNEAGDNKIYQNTTQLTSLQSSNKYIFEGIYGADGTTRINNPEKSNNNGELPIIIWQSKNASHSGRTYHAVNFITPEPQVTGSQGGQQQATFTYPLEAGQCAGAVARADPSGRVFDSQSLEPIANINVELSMMRAGGAFTKFESNEVPGGITNPWPTKEDGKFFFMVPAGTYRLNPVISDHTFPFTPANINPKYNKAYGDLYYGAGFTDQNILEDGKTLVHRDIPVDPKPGVQPYQAPVKRMDYSEIVDKSTNTYVISGRASHPLTKVQVYGKKVDTGATRLLIEASADKFGIFNIKVDQKQLDKNEVISEAKLIKVDLTKLSYRGPSLLERALSYLNHILMPVAQAQQQGTDTITLNPILNYLEGYAYDSAGQIIPSATVGIYLTFSNKAYYTTKADQNGYFKITSEYLPSMPYKIKYTSSTGTVTESTTTKFVTQNTNVIREKNIDLYSYKNQKGETARPTTAAGTQGQGPTLPADLNGTTGAGGRPATGIGMENQQTSTLLLVIILVFIAVVGAIVGVYLLKRNQPPQI